MAMCGVGACCWAESLQADDLSSADGHHHRRDGGRAARAPADASSGPFELSAEADEPASLANVSRGAYGGGDDRRSEEGDRRDGIAAGGPKRPDGGGGLNETSRAVAGKEGGAVRFAKR